MLTALDTLDVPDGARPGDVLGGYRLAGRIARGGMASIHVGVATDPKAEVPLVAVKLMLPHMLEDRSFVDMFLDEARLTTLIRHPNVCAVLDQGEHEGVPFLVMELLVGRDLGQLCRAVWRGSARLDLTRFASVVSRLVAEVCHGLHAAHELCDEDGNHLGVVHRDVSPHNVFVTEDGVAKVIDFGIAKALGSSHRTATGTVKGKFAYMAPEQLRGEPVDRRADVWSAGVMLWEAVTGHKLFGRKTEPETILAVLGAEVPPISDYAPDAPPGLQIVVDRSVRPEREDRYQTAEEMARDLEKIDAESPVSSAEIAQWMAALFAPKLAQDRGHIDSALRSLPPPSGLTGPTRSRVVARAARPWRSAVLAITALSALFGAGVVWQLRRAVPAPPAPAAARPRVAQSAPEPDSGVEARAAPPAPPPPPVVAPAPSVEALPAPQVSRHRRRPPRSGEPSSGPSSGAPAEATAAQSPEAPSSVFRELDY